MKTVYWLRIEGAVVFAIALFLFTILGGFAYPWWMVLLLFFAPDLSFLGYLFSNRLGAWAYNIAHSYIFPLVLYALANTDVLGLAALDLGALTLVWIAHIGFDRMLGYGLKEVTGFHDTHLGRIGRK